MDVSAPKQTADFSAHMITAAPPELDDVPPHKSVEDGTLEELEPQISWPRARTLFHTARTDDDTINSTRSLYDSDVEYKYIHGRQYAGEYYMPVDSEERTRMEILHGVFYRLLGNRLTTISALDPRRVLDIGTGTGEWAVAMAETFPQADVIGTDIAKIQPSAVPHNVYFEIDDAEFEGGWNWNEQEFDLIHFRYMAGAFQDWHHIYKQAFRHLRPGGWVEVMDFDDHGAFDMSGSFRSYFTPDSMVMQLLGACERAAIKSGRPRGIKHLQEKVLTDMGFVDVAMIERKIPMGIWPEDPEEQKVGKHFLVCQLAGVEAVGLRLLTEQMGWDIEDFRVKMRATVEALRAVALDPVKGKGLGFKVRILTGRRPGLSAG